VYEYTNICGVDRRYDDNGNLIDNGVNIYEYDYENHLIKVIRKEDGVVLGEYCYDALGRRIKKAVSEVVTSYVYDDDSVIEEHRREDVDAAYVYGDGRVLTMARGGFTYYYHTNAEGSIVVLTDEEGNIVEHYRYDSYGFPYIYCDQGVDGVWFTDDDVEGAYSIITNPHFFKGCRWDYLTELYYFERRYYDATIGRFLGAGVGYSEEDLINIEGHWSGPWKVYKTNRLGVYTDPNGQIVIEKQGELNIQIKQQKPSGGIVSGTIEIVGWNEDECGNWEGETETIDLTGWLDETNGRSPELKRDYSNLIVDFLWNFHKLEINASETGIFEQFKIRDSTVSSYPGPNKSVPNDDWSAHYRYDPYKNFKFRIKWDGRCKVSGLGASNDVVEYREGRDPSTRKSLGVSKYEELRLSVVWLWLFLP
jgi:hypothetical protein